MTFSKEIEVAVSIDSNLDGRAAAEARKLDFIRLDSHGG